MTNGLKRGWDSGCKDSTSGSTNRTEGKNTPFIKGYNLGFAECSSNSTPGTTPISNLTNETVILNTENNNLREQGYNDGCSDAMNGTVPSFLSEQSNTYRLGWKEGHDACVTETKAITKDTGGNNDLSSSTEEPLYTPQQRIVPPKPLDTPQPSQQPMLGGIDWISVCNSLQVALISSCDILVNPDNTLTTEGQRSVDCIRNGILLAGGGSFLANLPLPLVTTALQALEEPTGCGGIINWGLIGNVGDLQGIISLLT